jgi:hypothetical protein
VRFFTYHLSFTSFSLNIQQNKIISFPNFHTTISNFHQFENYYFLSTNKVLINNINNPSDLVIYKMDTLLNLVDSFKTTTNNWYYANSSVVFPNGDFVVGGVYSDAWEPDGDVWQKKYLRKFDKNLNIIWTKYFGLRNLNTYISKLIISSDGNIVGTGIDGYLSDSIGIHITGCIFKFTANGDSIWMHNYQAINDTTYGDNNSLLDIDEMPDGGFVACGNAEAFIPYRRRGWLLRVDANGCLIPNCVVGIEDKIEQQEFIIYPNPTHNSLTITNANEIAYYQIFQFDGKLMASGNSLPIDVSAYTSGLYFLKVSKNTNEVFNFKFMKQ